MSSTLWLIDRSRVEDGRGFCQRSRFNQYHLGPHGYGIALKGTKIPLATGTAYHTGLAKVLEYCRDAYTTLDELRRADAHPVPDTVVRGAVQVAQSEYYQQVAARGFAYMADQPAVKELLLEQQTLIEGLIWCWVLEVLPEVLARGRILEVEHDDTYVMGCTCGLGDGVLSKADHEGRACQGLGWMCKPDFILETWQTQELEYHEFKGTGQDGPSFRDKWEVMIQFFAAVLDVERRYGKHVQSTYVHGLLKGKRGQEYNPLTKKYDQGVERQGSILCYAYRKPANPPMEREEWAAQYEWQELDEKSGQVVTRRLGKVWQKAPIWELPDEFTSGEIQSKGEFWVKAIPPEVRRRQLVILGPFSRQTQAVPHFVEETIAEEGRWQQGLWALYELGQTILGEAYPGDGGPGTIADGVDSAAAWWEVVWPDPRFQALLDRHFPRSYHCRRYGLRYSCAFETLCFEKAGWERPLENGYIHRTPHHHDEQLQMEERGLTPPPEGAGVSPEEYE